MKRIHAFVSGEVQGVGYREEVKRIAFELNIYGWVKNLEDGRVEITAEGENKNIEKFLDNINIKRYPIFVAEVKVEEEIYKGEFMSFNVIRDKDLQKEILSALSRGTVDIHEVKEILQGVKHDTSSMLEKQDSLLGVTERGFEEMRKGFADLKEEIRTGFADVKEDTSDMKYTLSRIEVDIKDTKFSLSAFIEEKYQKLEGEIAVIKATLAGMQAAG